MFLINYNLIYTYGNMYGNTNGISCRLYSSYRIVFIKLIAYYAINFINANETRTHVSVSVAQCFTIKLLRLVNSTIC